MSFINKLVREPALTLGVITAGLSLLVLFGVPLSGDQMAGIGVFVGAVFALTRYLTTPTSEVIAQKKPNGEVVGGGVIPEVKGQLVEVNMGLTNPPGDVDVEPEPPDHYHPLP